MQKDATHDVFVALGSNLGDSAAILHRAFERLQTLSDLSILRSAFWKTSPVDCPPGAAIFLNAAAGLRARSAETPQSLLKTLQEIEREFGRQTKKVLNEPRPLDLDLISFQNRTLSEPQLILPHPRAHLRRFVLAPLAEIAPGLVLPGQVRTVRELLETLPPGESAVRI